MASENPIDFPHLMLKEIYEQPQAILATVERHLSGREVFGGELDAISESLPDLQRIVIAASGSSRHAGLAGEVMIEDLSGVAVDVEYASEYCYRSGVEPSDHLLVITITQSGETADAIMAQREAARRGARTLAICNVAHSTVAREADVVLLTHAGPERAVPATKSFTTQLTVLYLLALWLAQRHKRLTAEIVDSNISNLRALAASLSDSLEAWSRSAAQCAQELRDASSFLYLGRSVHYAIAREGALKLKEISYISAEGYPTGELKHGPYALVSEQAPLVVIASRDSADSNSVLRYQKSLALLEEVKQHGGKLIVVATDGDADVARLADHAFYVPAASELLLPIAEVIPLQLLAYHIAVLHGCDVDQPRNLVKAVVRE